MRWAEATQRFLASVPALQAQRVSGAAALAALRPWAEILVPEPLPLALAVGEIVAGEVRLYPSA
jgi:hypothetical protein